MTPKEKANKLVDAFYQELPLEKYVTISDGELSWEYNHWNNSKQCAIIMVDEIINNNTTIPILPNIHIDINTAYWQQVKQEIEKI